MAIKPIDMDDDELNENELQSRGSMLKTVLLLAIITFGAYFGFYYQHNQEAIQSRMVRAGVKPTLQPTEQPFKPVAAHNPDVDKTLGQLRDESNKLVNSGLAQVAGVGGAVLGSATKSVQTTASDTTQAVTDSLYKNTIGQVILQLFNQLPPGAKKEVVEELVKQTTPTASPTPEKTEEEH